MLIDKDEDLKMRKYCGTVTTKNVGEKEVRFWEGDESSLIIQKEINIKA